MTENSETGPMKARKVAKIATGTMARTHPASGPAKALIDGAKSAATNGATAISATITSSPGPKRPPGYVPVPGPDGGTAENQFANSNVPFAKLNRNRTGNTTLTVKVVITTSMQADYSRNSLQQGWRKMSDVQKSSTAE